jgi:hypothetical protein
MISSLKWLFAWVHDFWLCFRQKIYLLPKWAYYMAVFLWLLPMGTIWFSVFLYFMIPRKISPEKNRE